VAQLWLEESSAPEKDFLELFDDQMTVLLYVQISHYTKSQKVQSSEAIDIRGENILFSTQKGG